MSTSFIYILRRITKWARNENQQIINPKIKKNKEENTHLSRNKL